MDGAVFPPCYLPGAQLWWRRKWQHTPVFLAWRIPWTEEPGGLYSTGSQRVNTTEWLHFHFHTMVEVMKTMATSFKRSHVCTATLSAPNLAAGHHQPTPPPETPGYSRTRLGQSLVGSLLLSPGSWCTQGTVCALQESISHIQISYWQKKIFRKIY